MLGNRSTVQAVLAGSTKCSPARTDRQTTIISDRRVASAEKMKMGKDRASPYNTFAHKQLQPSKDDLGVFT